MSPLLVCKPVLKWWVHVHMYICTCRYGTCNERFSRNQFEQIEIKDCYGIVYVIVIHMEGSLMYLIY